MSDFPLFSLDSYLVVLDHTELTDAVTYLQSQDAWSFDVETLGTHRGDPVRNTVAWIAFATADRTIVIPCGHPNGELERVEMPLLKSGRDRQAKGLELREQDYSKDRRKQIKYFHPAPTQLYRHEVFEALEPVFHSSALKIAHNAKFDINSVSKYLSSPVVGPFFDTQTAEWCVDSRRHGSLRLNDCVARTLRKTLVKGVGEDITQHTFDEVAEYAALDAAATYVLADRVCAQIDADEQLRRVFDLEMEVLPVLAEMERTGALVDDAALSALDDDFAAATEQARADLYAAAGTVFNINSVKDKQRILYGPKADGGQGLTPIKLSPGGEKKVDSGQPLTIHDYSTDSAALDALPGNNAVVRHLRDYSKYHKLRSTYTLPYRGGVTEKKRGSKTVSEEVVSRLYKGRIHTTFVQSRVETGRLSSRSPNLQNVPARTAESKRIRDLFIASPGYKLVQADFSQIEPRIIASLSADPTMISAYRDERDLYQEIAYKLGVSRDVAKTLVLSIAYGIGPGTIAERTGLSKAQARDLMDYFSKQFPRITHYKRNVILQARARKPVPYSETILGRRRYIPELFYSDDGQRASGERRAFNHVIQGTAGDILKIALIKARRLAPSESRMLLTVHDEIILESPEKLVRATATALQSAMESSGARWLRVPLVAETKVVDRWSETK